MLWAVQDSHLNWERCSGEVSPHPSPPHSLEGVSWLALRRSELPEFMILKGQSDMRVKQNNRSEGSPGVKDSIYRVRGYFISVRQAE